MVFGVIPLLGYVAFAGSKLSSSTLFIIACVLTAVMLFTLGALKVRAAPRRVWLCLAVPIAPRLLTRLLPRVSQSTLTNQAWWKSGAEILAMGSFTAGIAYVIGFLVEEILASDGSIGCY